MKIWKLLLSGVFIIIILGAYACNTNNFPAATSAGFVHPVVTLTPTKKPVNPTSTNHLTPTENRLPTSTPTKSPKPPASATPQPAATQICKGSTGHIEERQLGSDVLDEPLEYLVYLPPCYDDQIEQHYPVLYLFHGQTYTNQHWIDLGAIGIADRLISSGELSPFIMVFPYDRDHYKPPSDNPFGQVVLLELIPAVDDEFRTIPAREARAIGGISRGGNWAAHLSLQRPELFSAIGLHSTPIFSTDTNRELIEWLEAIPTDEFPRLFLDIGQNDRWLKYTLIFEDLLNNASIPHEWHLYPGFHEDEYWEAHMEQYIRWYALPWDAVGKVN